MSRRGTFTHVGDAALDPGVAAFIAKLRATAAELALRHAQRMADAPPGACERCYQVGCDCYNPTRPTGVRPAVNVPFEFADCTFANYEPRVGTQAALAKAKAFLDSGRDLYLFGGVGSGKTRLACTIANEARTARRGGHFERVPRLLYDLLPGSDDDAQRDKMQVLRTTPLLVLDDVGAERDVATDYTRRTLLMLYEDRCDGGLRTIFTSNKSVDDLGAALDDDRLASRIAGRCDLVRLTASDQRLVHRPKGRRGE